MLNKIIKYGYRILYYLIGVIMLNSCAQHRPLVTTNFADTQLPIEDYLIGPEDAIEVLVWKNPDLSRVVNVRPDGKISLPLIGDVQAAGVSVMQLNTEIVERLKKFYKEPPQVSVIVQQVNSYSIYILGEVRSPGKYLVKSGTTFLQSVTLAGGFTEFASKNKIMIRRKSNGNSEDIILIKYNNIVSGVQKNVMIYPGDTILVP